MTTTRDLYTVDPGARPRPRITLMLPPTVEATRAALVTSVYHARELLSEAFRAVDEKRVNAPLDPPPSAEELDAPAEKIRGATAMLAGAIGVLRSVRMYNDTDSDTVFGHREIARWRAIEWLERAVAAGKVASAHGGYVFMYRTQLAEHDKRHFVKSLAIWTRATEAAVQEAHRALAELAELMPDAYETANE